MAGVYIPTIAQGRSKGQPVGSVIVREIDLPFVAIDDTGDSFFELFWRGWILQEEINGLTRVANIEHDTGGLTNTGISVNNQSHPEVIRAVKDGTLTMEQAKGWCYAKYYLNAVGPWLQSLKTKDERILMLFLVWTFHGTRQHLVSMIQRSALTYDSRKIDGVYGPNTATAWGKMTPEQVAFVVANFGSILEQRAAFLRYHWNNKPVNQRMDQATQENVLRRSERDVRRILGYLPGYMFPGPPVFMTNGLGTPT